MTGPLPGPRRSIAQSTLAALTRMTTPEAMQALAEAAALTARRELSPEYRDVLDAAPLRVESGAR